MASIPKINDVGLDTKIHVPNVLRFNYSDVSSKSVVVGLESKKSRPRNFIFLGKIKETNPSRSFYNFNLWLNVDFPHIILICGKRGTGKSYTLGTIAEGLIAPNDLKVSTMDKPNYATLIFDTLGQFWQMWYQASQEEEKVTSINSWGLKPSGFDTVRVFVPRGVKDFFQNGNFCLSAPQIWI